MSVPHRLKCAETWAGNQGTSSVVELPGLRVWVHSTPFGPDEAGGDVHYVSVCPSCIVSRIALDVMHEAIRTRPTLQRRVLAYNEALLAQAYHTVACNAVHPVEARCCRWILSTQDRVRQTDLPLTHEFLAEMLGVQRSTVSLVVRALQTAGLIRQGRGVISVSDRAGLEESACECYGAIRRNLERLLPHTYTNE